MKFLKAFFVFSLMFFTTDSFCEDYLLHTVMAHTDYVKSVDFSRDGKYVYSGGYDDRLVKWRIDNSEALVYLTGDAKPQADSEEQIEAKPKAHKDIINCVRVNMAGDTIATASNDATIKIWSYSKDMLSATLKGHSHYVNSVNFSDDGKKIVSAGADKKVLVTGAQKPFSVLLTLTGHKDIVRDAVFSPNGLYIVSGGDDSSVRVWSAKPERPFSPQAATPARSPAFLLTMRENA
jgi:WD40 repeat protein